MSRKEIVLIVDDDKIEKEILKRLLRDRYDIVEASNGQEALDIIQRRADELSLIILDIYMPVIDGYAVLGEIDRNNKWKNIPVVVTTSECSIESDQRLLELGAHTILHKPVQAGIARQQIANIIDRQNKQKIFIQDYMLQENLIHRTANTLLCVYHFGEKSIGLGENYQDFFDESFPKVFDSYPFQLENFVLPKNMEEAQDFFAIWDKSKMYDEIELRLRIDALHYEWFKIAIMIQCDVHKRRETAVFMFTNIEYEVEAKEKLTFMAKNDPLTSIPNRRTFSSDVMAMLSQYPDEQFYMITMDIAQFHMFNKLFGYSEGDSVLRYFAIKLQERMESFEKGVYCRMSSDTFYACLSEQDDITEFMSGLQTIWANYPLKFDFKLYFGIYKIVDRAEAVEQMLEHAAYACQMVKKSPFQNIQYYDEKLKEKEYFEAVVVSEMEQALKSEQFEVFYQPKCNLHTRKIVGAEALVRWNNPDKGYLSPGIFIPIFEQNGFITELDYFVCESVCKKLREWMDKGMNPVPVSVNISRCDLYDSELCERIFAMVEKYNLPHDLIEFEITESAFILESKLLASFTKELRKRDFCVLIDDFGSGYSSLNSLKNIDVDVLKIDIAFLPASAKELKSPIILAAVIEMAQKLGLKTVAEGVETLEQLNLVGELGCENIQGYYFYKPVPVQEFEKLLLQEGSRNLI